VVTQAAPPADAPPAVQQAFTQGTAVAPDLVAAHNGLGLALFQTLRQGAPAANLTLSPLSVAQCLGMIYNGSAGATLLRTPARTNAGPSLLQLPPRATYWSRAHDLLSPGSYEQ